MVHLPETTGLWNGSALPWDRKTAYGRVGRLLSVVSPREDCELSSANVEPEPEGEVASARKSSLACGFGLNMNEVCKDSMLSGLSAACST